MVKSVFGWITPTRRFVPTEMWNHLKEISGDAELRSLVPDFDEMISSVECVREGCLALIDEGEHPEWHSYEIAESHCYWKAMENLYKAGAIRVGSRQDYLHFEGTPEGIHSLYQFCKDLADSYEMGCVFEPKKLAGN
jgi:hypothetical protein